MLRLLTVICAIAVLLSCSKKSGSEDQDKEKAAKITFEFNGKKYDLNRNIGLGFRDDEFLFISIDRPDLFGGKIFFYNNSTLYNNCAYLAPTGQVFDWHPNGCILTINGNPVDSAQVYLYRSGTLTYTKSNFRHKKERTSAGTWVEFDVYDLTGSFSLTLANKNNQTIVITDGSFSFYELSY